MSCDRETRQAGTLSPVEKIEMRLLDRKRHSPGDGLLATKQGKGETGIKNAAKRASQGGLWAVYWFSHTPHQRHHQCLHHHHHHRSVRT